MERGWIETIRLLGLDVVLLVTVALAVLDWIFHRVGSALARRALARQAAHREPLQPQRPAGTAGKAPGQPEMAWPPTAWRASH